MTIADAEMLPPRWFKLTTFPKKDGYDELLLARDISSTPRGGSRERSTPRTTSWVVGDGSQHR
jgi:hypothetical protein